MAKTRVWDEKTKRWIWVEQGESTDGKGVTVYRDGFGQPLKSAPTNDAPYGRDGFGQPLKSAPVNTAPYGRDGFGQPLKSAPNNSAPYGRDGFGQPLKSAPTDTAPYGRDGFGQPLPAPKNVLQGPGMYGPVGSADQVAGMLRDKLGIKQPGPTEQELDTYDPLGSVTSIIKQILGASGSGSKSKATISRAVLQKALTKAKNEIAGAYDAATPAVAAAFANNPYSGLQAQETVVDPGLSALFQSQGVSMNPLEQMLASNREASGQRTSALNDMYKLMGAQFAQQGTQQQADIAQQRAGSLDELLQNYAAILGSGKVY